MTLQTKTESSGVGRTPPTFGEGKSWRLRTFEWNSRNPQDPDGEPLSTMAMLTKGMPVHEKLHAAYWEARDISATAIAAYRRAGIPPPYPYFLLDNNDVNVGHGAFDAHDDADDMAWISCMFLEMGLRTAVPMSPDMTAEDAGPPIYAAEKQANAED